MDEVDELLMAAVDAGHLESVKQWLERHPGRIDGVRDGRGRTPLHRAAATDNYVLAALIEQAMSDPYARDDQGLLAIDYPPGEKETDARRILRRTFDGHQKSLSRLLEPPFESPEVRIISQSIDTWRRIARHRLLPTGKTALMIGCEANRADVASRLLKNGANPARADWAQGWTALNYAIDADAGKCLSMLLDADQTLRDAPIRVVVDDNLPALLAPLHLAAWTGKASCVDVLLGSGVAIDERASGDRHAWTALHLAALGGHRGVVERLLAAGADATQAESCQGFNALQIAMQHKHDDLIATLQSWGKERGVDLLPFFQHDQLGTAGKFPLYRAPVRAANARCTICGQEKPCLGVHSLIAPCPSCAKPRTWEVEQANQITRCEWCDRQTEWPKDWPWESDQIQVCVDCLRAGHAAILHATDFGLIVPQYAVRGMIQGGDEDVSRANAAGFETTVLKTYDDGSQSIGIHIPRELIDDLMRTPTHPTLQEEHWTFHCGGWMVYLGQWEIQDFERQPPGRAYEWFAEHFSDPDDAEMYWDWIEGDMGWSCVFVCPQCGRYKVFYDVT